MNRKQRKAQQKTAPRAAAAASAQALLEAAIQHHNAGRMNEAEHIYRDILALDSRHADALHLLGVIALQTGRHAVAADLIGQAVAISPNAAMYHSNRAVALKELGRPLEALACYDAALRLKPDYVEVHFNRGNVLNVLGRLGEALKSYQAALLIKPDHAGALTQRGNALYDLGRPDYASAFHRRALRVNPHHTGACAELVSCLQQACAWDDIAYWQQELLSRIPEQAAHIQPFPLLSFDSTPAQQLAVARKVIRPAEALPVQPPRGDGKIRLGYLSGDFRDHPVARLIVELIERHDRGRFDVTGYSYGPEDGSPIRQRLVEAFDRFADVRPLSHIDAARLIHRDGIDVLIDLTGHTHGGRPQILAFRPAPVQVNFLGYPGTMGTDFIDYIIADPVCVPPGDEAFFSEKIVRLPDSYQPNDSKRQISPHTPSREAAGLPDQGMVFCCFNNAFKITPAVFALWMRLLSQVPGSVLWLLDANAAAKDNLRREAAKAGIAPERLVFAPRLPLADHMARHRLADLFLDTLPYNAHTTASDALWTGLPVLTCRGETFAGRVAASLLTAVGMPELITASLAEYEALALTLANDPSRIAALKQKLAANRDTAPLFDTGRFARNIEAAYERITPPPPPPAPPPPRHC
jgi:predicted O-linked N-acetylglucosamine transferase (SPINDLY family)